MIGDATSPSVAGIEPDRPIQDMAVGGVCRPMQDASPQAGIRDRSVSGNRGPTQLGTILGATALAIAVIALVVAVTVPRPSPSPTPSASAWANVSASGALLGGYGVQSVQHEAVGAYFIMFNVKINAGCSEEATPYGYPPADVIVDPSYGPSPGSVNLYTFSSTNAAPVNSSFSLVIFC